jgi:hypothetical protein
MKTVIGIGLTAATLTAMTLEGCNMFGGGVASPQRKAGLWEQTLQTEQSPTPIVTQLCFDAASDRRMPVLPRKPRRAGACTSFSESKSGDGYVVDSVCGFGGVKITNHAVLSGDFSSKYTVATTINVEGAPDAARNGQHKTTLTAVYKGECPPEIQPGQVKLPNGDVVEMAQLRRGGFGGGFGGGRREGGNSASNSAGADQGASNSAPAQ